MPEIPYEITQTVVPSKICNGKKYKEMLASEQWKYLQYMVYEICKKYDLEYVIYPEFHKNYNIHIHGVINIPDKIKKIDLVDIQKRFERLGRCHFKKINNMTSWMSYIKKNQEEIDNKHYKSPGYEKKSVQFYE